MYEIGKFHCGCACSHLKTLSHTVVHRRFVIKMDANVIRPLSPDLARILKHVLNF